MTTYGGICNPASDRKGGLTIVSKLGPTKGSPTPPSGQLSATNKRLRTTATQGDAGAGCFKGIWADPCGRGGKKK